MSSHPFIVLGSSRSFGNTRKAILDILENKEWPIEDLNDLNLNPYDYEYRHQQDDFIPLIERLVLHDHIILATPVYWYTMSATMKIFIDRLSDLLDIRKDLGRKLRGKKLFVIASFNTSLPKGFEEAFEQTCDYLGMSYLGTSFIYSGSENQDFLEKNKQEIQKAQAILQNI